MSLKNSNPLKSIYNRYPNLSLLWGLFALTLIMFSVSLPNKFFTISNFSSIAFQLPELGILTMAMAITMLSGGINLSIIATANLSGIVMATIMTSMVQGPQGWVITLAIIADLGVAVLVGLVNGIIVAFIGVSPILATLGTMTLVNGISILTTKGYVISGLPEQMQFFGNKAIMGIPVPFIIFALLAIAIGFWLKKMPSGLNNYLIGSNETATRYSGVNTKSVLLKTS